MKASEFEDMLEALAAGWTERDYEVVSGHFAEDVYYADPLNYVIRDPRSLLDFFRNDGCHPQHCIFRNTLFDEYRQIGAAEYTYEGTFRYHGTVWIELTDDRISGWREYQHKAEQSWEEFWER